MTTRNQIRSALFLYTDAFYPSTVQLNQAFYKPHHADTILILALCDFHKLALVKELHDKIHTAQAVIPSGTLVNIIGDVWEEQRTERCLNQLAIFTEFAHKVKQHNSLGRNIACNLLLETIVHVLFKNIKD